MLHQKSHNAHFPIRCKYLEDTIAGFKFNFWAICNYKLVLTFLLASSQRQNIQFDKEKFL